MVIIKIFLIWAIKFRQIKICVSVFRLGSLEKKNQIINAFELPGNDELNINHMKLNVLSTLFKQWCNIYLIVIFYYIPK